MSNSFALLNARLITPEGLKTNTNLYIRGKTISLEQGVSPQEISLGIDAHEYVVLPAFINASAEANVIDPILIKFLLG